MLEERIKSYRWVIFLVALAWVYEDEMQNISLFPEFLSVDVTFGVNKERRNLLRVCGINGNFKFLLLSIVSCLLNYFMLMTGYVE